MNSGSGGRMGAPVPTPIKVTAAALVPISATLDKINDERYKQIRITTARFTTKEKKKDEEEEIFL